MDKLATTLATSAHAAVRDYDDNGPQILTKNQRADAAMVLIRIISNATGLDIAQIVEHARRDDLQTFLTWLSFHVATEEG